MKRIVILLVFTLILTSCEEEKTIYVADHSITCTTDSSEKCLLVKEKESGEWQEFSENIEGFTYEEGYAYKLKITITKDANSKLIYKLKEVISKTETPNSMQEKVDNPSIQIRYSATSRAYGSTLLLTNNLLTYNQARPTAKKTEKKLDESELNQIIELVHALDLNRIEKLTPPSNAFTYDGAAGAIIELTIDGKKYRTPTFDYGNPPEAIKSLIDTLEKLK